MNVQDFLTDQCTRVTLKDGLTFVDAASFRALTILIFHASMEKKIQHLYHRQLVFAWHNLKLPAQQLFDQIMGILDEYQNGKLSQTDLPATPRQVFRAGVDLCHVWLCSFVMVDFVGEKNSENRESMKKTLTKLAQLINKDYNDFWDDEEEEEYEDDQAQFPYGETPNTEKLNVFGQNNHNGEEEEPLLIALRCTIPDIKDYLENLDQNEPVSRIPPNIHEPEFDEEEEVPYDTEQPFPLRTDCDVISEHFYYTGLKVLAKISYSEYVGCAWTTDEKEELSPHIAELENHFERTMSIINDSILTISDINIRLDVIERWIDIMETAYESHNYLFAFEIEAALKKPSIANQVSTWRDIRKDYKLKYKQLQTKMSTYKCYDQYKKDLKQAPVRETLPFINPWLTEMYLTEEGNPNYKKLPNGEQGVNFAKQFGYYTSVEFLKQPWGVDIEFLLNEKLLHDIENYTPILPTEDTVMKTSRIVERSVVLSPSPRPRK